MKTLEELQVYVERIQQTVNAGVPVDFQQAFAGVVTLCNNVIMDFQRQLEEKDNGETPDNPGHTSEAGGGD